MNTPASLHKSLTEFPSLRRVRVATILLAVVFSVIVVTAAVYHLTVEYKIAVDTATRQARGAVMTVESHAARTFGETAHIVEGIGDVYMDEDEHNRFDEAYLHGLMAEKLKRMPYLAGIMIVDPTLHGIAGAQVYPVSADLSFTDRVKVPDPDGSPNFVIGPISTARGGAATQWLLSIGTRLSDAKGTPRGYVLAWVRQTFFTDFYKTLDVGTHGQIDLWTVTGHLFAATANETIATGTYDQAMVRAATEFGPRTSATAASFVPLSGLREVKAEASIADLPLTAILTLSGDDFLADWREMRNRIGAGSVAILLAMVAFAVMILNQLRRLEQNEAALRAAKAAAEEASEAKSRFLAHMSHEFRTPLNAIMGFSDIIKNKIMGNYVAPVYTSYAEHIHRSGEHLLNIVNDILDMAKIESGAQLLQRDAMSAGEVITAAVSFVAGIAGQRSLQVLADIQPGLPAVVGDERFTRQVLINLLSNAIKFSPPGASVMVAGRRGPEGSVDIAVTDQGPGIEPMILKRLGEPFLQGNPSVSRPAQGTGLGLSICKHYMDLLGGQLVIESAIGGGTTAIMRFPLDLLDKRSIAVA